MSTSKKRGHGWGEVTEVDTQLLSEHGLALDDKIKVRFKLTDGTERVDDCIAIGAKMVGGKAQVLVVSANGSTSQYTPFSNVIKRGEQQRQEIKEEKDSTHKQEKEKETHKKEEEKETQDKEPLCGDCQNPLMASYKRIDCDCKMCKKRFPWCTICVMFFRFPTRGYCYACKQTPEYAKTCKENE